MRLQSCCNIFDTTIIATRDERAFEVFEQEMDLLDELFSVFDDPQDDSCSEEQWDKFSSFIWKVTNNMFKLKTPQQRNQFKSQFMAFERNSDRLRYIRNDKQFANEIDFIYGNLVKRASLESRSQPKQSDNEKAAEFTEECEIPVYSENWKLPGAPSYIDLCIDSQKGRYLKTNVPIKRGTIVMSEVGHTTWLTPHYYLKFCQFCLKKVGKRFVACRACTAVRYCSMDCEKSAWTRFHSFECKCLHLLKYCSFTHLAMRLIVTFGFENILKTIERGNVDITTFAVNGFPANYASFYSLFGDGSNLNYEQLVSFSVGALIVAKIAEGANFIKQDSPVYYTFAEILMKHVFQTNLNCFSSTEKGFKFHRDLQVHTYNNFGLKTGIVLTFGTSLVSHSCDFNCDWYTIGSQVFLLSNRDIKAGEELSITYYPYYKKMAFKDRQLFLKEHYLFVCRCVACEARYENVDYSFRCSKCGGPFIWHSEGDGYCVNCGYKSSDISSFLNNVHRASKAIQKAKDLLDLRKLQAAKKQLNKAFDLNKKTYISYIPQLHVTEQLCHYYSLKKEYYKAFNQCLNLAAIQRQLMHNDSLEEVAILVKALRFLSKAIDSSFLKKASLKQKGEDVYQKIVSITEKVEEQQFKAVSDSGARNLKQIDEVCRKFSMKTKMNVEF
ncbi:SET and MYND domain-containing protein (SMYD)-like protein [Leptotrombidium deliense]|uniref:SET and MYND domain-containing protein (SMYD)-like protein n=1 Tax=Leptotrombidium deliense TaxID=299467 RepID=A0A443SNE3_9ACAR|nr:SET and MYND domain-containing protein (SMYD)-like protein [Leptotrombidium deliense]